MKNRKKLPSVNLVSLMDIFTVLVFFLLLNVDSGVEAFVTAGGEVSVPTYEVQGDEVDVSLPLITLMADGKVFLNDEIYPNVETMVEYASGQGVSLARLIFKASADTEYANLKETIDALNAIGTVDISLLTSEQVKEAV